MKDKEKIIKKIKSLLAKTAENGATEDEAVSALRKAEQLVAEYDIARYELNDNSNNERCILKRTPLIKSSYNLGIFYHDLSELFCCIHFFDKKNISFYGYEQDVELCLYFYTTIIKSCLRAIEEYKNSDNFQVEKIYSHSRSLTASFAKGYILSIAEKMEDIYLERRKIRSNDKTYNLMIRDKKDNVKKRFDSLGIKFKTETTPVKISHERAFKDGSKKAKDFNLTQAMNQNNNKTKLLGV